ncbi:MAG: class I SAM-dependent methyltransferase [Nitrospiraceae bacterium]
MSYRESLIEHLAWWGLRRFESDAAYFHWQRQVLSATDLTDLNLLVEQKRTPGPGAAPEVAFYDFTAAPQILPVLYSQRYDYYEALGPRVAERIGDAQSVLDFGCGPGVLATFYARQFPDIAFVGIDRSEASVRVARERASALGLTNIRFEYLDAGQDRVSGTYDLVISAHALLQSESDSGIPSTTWQTFDRPADGALQADFERRTGLDVRLDAVSRALTPQGRFIIFEKTRQLARRVPFQRALRARGFHLLEPPLPLRYLIVEEVADDGPLFVLTRHSAAVGETSIPWSEAPEYRDDDELCRCDGVAATAVHERLPDRTVIHTESLDVRPFGLIHIERGVAAGSLAYLYVTAAGSSVLLVGGEAAIQAAGRTTERLSEWLRAASGRPDTPDLSTLPLYENHTVAAQFAWSRLSNQDILKTTTLEEAGGRQVHVELGKVPKLIYLYWANTFDQRQLVVIEESRAHVLEQYYQEFLDGR